MLLLNAVTLFCGQQIKLVVVVAYVSCASQRKMNIDTIPLFIKAKFLPLIFYAKKLS